MYLYILATALTLLAEVPTLSPLLSMHSLTLSHSSTSPETPILYLSIADTLELFSFILRN